MMLILTECGLGDGCHEEIKSRVRKLIEGERRSYLIVPEQQTVMAEGEMVAELPERAPLYFEVTNFTRLADTVFRSLGGICGNYADKSKKALIMWRTLAELSPALDMTLGASEISEGLVERALSAVGELDSHAITPDELEECLARGDSASRLQKKLSDLALISALYKKLLHEKYSDTEEGLISLAEKLKSAPDFFSGVEFFVEGFTSFTEPQYMILEQLMKSASVTVLLPLPRAGADAFEYLEIRKTKERILKSAARVGCERKLIRMSDTYTEKPPILLEAERLLWRTTGEIDKEGLQNTNCLRIFEAHTPFDECDFVAADIKRRVMEGAKYSDIAIICRSSDSYLGVLDVALQKSEIPHFMSHAREASEFEAVKFIYTAYAAVLGGFHREDVISYAKCGFCGISREERDEFEIYAERWQIGGKQFTSGALWNMNPDGYTTRWQEASHSKLLRINKTRDRIIAPLVRLAGKIKGKREVSEHARLLLDFLLEMKIPFKLSKRAEEAARAGRHELAEETAALWKIICDALDSAVEALGDTKVSAETFVGQLKIVFSAIGVGRIPSFIDEVTVGSAGMLRLYGKRHIYLLGVNYGQFPATPSDDSFFTEHDKCTLAELGLPIEPDMEVRCAKELFAFTRAFSFAKESVTICYTESGTDFKATPKAEVISRITDISRQTVVPVKLSELSTLEGIYTPSQALEATGGMTAAEKLALHEALVECGYGGTAYRTDADIENGELRLTAQACDMIYSDELALTQTRIDSYTSCPLGYFCKYDLRLDGGQPYEMDYSGIGSFVHAILEDFFGTAEREGLDLASLSNEDKARLTLDASRKYLGALCGEESLSSKTKISLTRLYRATLPVVDDICDELSGSLFKPKFFELGIKSGDSENPAPVIFEGEENTRVSVYGQIDRVDTYKNGNDVYVRVIDYKTGSKKFSPDDLKEGKNLQMFLYLKSVTDTKNEGFLKKIGAGDGGRLIPAGVIYVKTALSDVKIERDAKEEALAAIKKNQGRQGMILSDPISMAAQNPAYLPVKFKNDGSPYAASEKYLYTPEGWDSLMKTVSEVIGDISQRMRAGDIHAAKPRKGDKSPCEYCEYKPICRRVHIG